MKNIYVLKGSDLAFDSLDDVIAFIRMCKENPDKYAPCDIADFDEHNVWTPPKEEAKGLAAAMLRSMIEIYERRV